VSGHGAAASACCMWGDECALNAIATRKNGVVLLVEWSSGRRVEGNPFRVMWPERIDNPTQAILLHHDPVTAHYRQLSYGGQVALQMATLPADVLSLWGGPLAARLTAKHLHPSICAEHAAYIDACTMRRPPIVTLALSARPPAPSGGLEAVQRQPPPAPLGAPFSTAPPSATPAAAAAGTPSEIEAGAGSATPAASAAACTPSEFEAAAACSTPAAGGTTPSECEAGAASATPSASEAPAAAGPPSEWPVTVRHDQAAAVAGYPKLMADIDAECGCLEEMASSGTSGAKLVRWGGLESCAALMASLAVANPELLPQVRRDGFYSCSAGIP
jgi:hypothetical protein